MYPIWPTSETARSRLQATIAAATSSDEIVVPHHPITCNEGLYYDEAGCLSCDHTKLGPDDKRTKQCVTHSVALLLIELAMAL